MPRMNAIPPAALAAVAALAAAGQTPSAPWTRTETSVAPGITRIELHRDAPACDVHMVALDRTAALGVRFRVRQAGDGLFGTATVPELARELDAEPGAGRVIAGVNGDFFDNGRCSPTYGMPLGLVVAGGFWHGGELVTTGHLAPGVLYSRPDEMLYEWRDRADRRELRLGKLAFHGEIHSHPEGGGAVTNAFRLVNPLLADLDPDPAKQPDELVVLTARWTKPIPAPGVRVRHFPGLSKNPPTGLLAPYWGCGELEILGPVEKGDRLSGDPLEGAIVGLGSAAGTAKALLGARAPEDARRPKPIFGGGRPDLVLHAGFDRDPGVGEDFFMVAEAVRPWTTPMRDGVLFDTHEEYDYPRTMVGLGTNRVVLLVADGRSSRSHGLPSREAATLLAAEGCTDVAQFDGGGSATLLVGDAIVNHPSDGSPRPVANGLFLAQSSLSPAEAASMLSPPAHP